ncbi:TetR/AcrR family transcriptional regulator [Deinococcus multiflagellatus]|uniref:TetR/AcrR family transcriptional regulator n=1 Tax=Deinococcus multiflagellatus TaxID=1656887 RepID=A0ABW1ZLU4_9DEIO|nr:TetR/AcrR family transcriptional regulator [Deinococcus multiflagellatus]MBZ9714844.1 TetR/AcrR family transcriptional regulator; helix-turn-helix transcriptional regulator [Deinococcus multiflagellatus]
MNLPTSPDAPTAAEPGAAPLSLRQRRQQELRQQLSDVATQMFLERGFDAVRVADVARACGVTEKTVFNHFPTKESLLSDRWDDMAQALRRKLTDPALTPVAAALAVLGTELSFLTASGTSGAPSLAQVRRYSDLIRTAPSLMAHQRRALDRLCDAAALALAERTGAAPEDPEVLITAAALSGLWTVYFHSLRRHLYLDDGAQVRAEVECDLRRAADVLRLGLERTPGDAAEGRKAARQTSPT